MNMRFKLTVLACAASIALSSLCTTAMGFQVGVQVEVDDSMEALDIIAGSSRRLKFEYSVPELMVENPDIIQATPVSPSEVLVSGLKQGISTITVSDVNKKLHTIAIHVKVDVRNLERAFEKHFPDSQIRVDALQTAVVLSGYVARADQVENVVLVARDYFPANVINQLQVHGSQNIAIKVKVYEVSRTKLRKLGVDWSIIGRKAGAVSNVSEIIQAFSLNDPTVGPTAGGQNITAGVLGDDVAFNAFIQALEQRNIAKLLDEPVLVAQNGRPAEFLSGGEVPIQVAAGLGSNAIQFRPFGTKLDIVPIVQGQGQLMLEVRAEVSEIANDLSGTSGVPGFRVRRVNTGVKMKAGHTLALAGDYRENTQAATRGVPKVMDTPILGSLFRKIEDTENETELVFIITPRFISEVEPQLLPARGPGQLTQSPSDKEFFYNGHVEVPRCNTDCPVSDRFDDPYAQQQQQLMPAAPDYGTPAIPTVDENLNGQPTQVIVPTNNDYSYRPAQPAIQSTRQANGISGFAWPNQTR